MDVLSPSFTVERNLLWVPAAWTTCPVELPSASLADAASIVPLSHPSARSEKWYYYRRLADGETGAQSRSGT